MIWTPWRCLGSRRTLRRAFVQRYMDAAAAERLWQHLHACTTCRRRYDDMIYLDRLATTGGASSTQPAALEVALWRQRVASAHSPTASIATVSTKRRRWWALALIPAAATVLAVILQPADDTFVARGGVGEALSVRAFCEERDAAGKASLRSISEHPTPHESASCSNASTLRFAYQSTRGGMLYVLTGTASDELRLIPGPSGDGAWPIAMAHELTPLPITFGAGWGDGRDALDVVFVLSDESLGPTDWARIAATPPVDLSVVRRRIWLGPDHPAFGE